VVPGAGVVAGPGDSITLTSGKARACHDKGTHVGLESQQTVIGPAAVLHAEDVVDFKMIGDARGESRLFDAVLHIIGHSF
jgi:hypothetical protein